MCFIKSTLKQRGFQTIWKAVYLPVFFLTIIIVLLINIPVSGAAQGEGDVKIKKPAVSEKVFASGAAQGEGGVKALPGNAPAAENDGGEYVLGPGDVLDIRVFGEPEVSSTVMVRIDGRISLPLAGEVVAAGTTPELLGEQIRQELERFIDAPNVVVMLTESRSKKYYILGEVESPGEYDITRPVTVLQAIARAGGFAEWAKKDSIMIVSEPGSSEKISIFDYDRFLNDADSKKNVVIKPGDTIVVP